jgi:sterol desaturase/sphingolipid hydroxylase (fatty acid hydroxylase superfamily)
MMIYVIFFLSGIFTWTFLEYSIHRFLGHVRKNNPVSEEHIMHHSKGNYFAPLYKKIIAAIIVVSTLSVILNMVIDFSYAVLFASGLGGMYLAYEATHFMFHKIAPLTYWGRILRKHHFYHHYKNPNKNFGVTNRLWDRVFGTFNQAEIQLRVPAQVSTPWIMKNQQNQKITRDYLLIEKK